MAVSPVSVPSWEERVLAVLGSGHEVRGSHVAAMSDEDLVALGAAAGAVRRGVDRMLAVVAAEQASRSRADVGRAGAGLARRRGRGDERGLVAGQTGGSAADAGRLIEMGEALVAAERAAEGGADGHTGSGGADGKDLAVEASRPVFAEVAAAVRTGRLGVDASTAITRMLSRVAQRCGADEVARSERDLVTAAAHMPLERLYQLINRHEARLDAAHLEELAETRRARRFVRIGENADGMIRLSGQLDPENGAPLVAVLDAMVTQNFRNRKKALDAVKAGEDVSVDDRTPEQVRADAMGDFARHLAGCTVDVLPRAGVTVVVRMNYDDLLAMADRDGGAPGGCVQVDGLSSTPSAGQLRRMLAGAGIIPQVLGGKSEVLDHGRRQRDFSPAQKQALLARDGGCAKCGAPPSWCDAHHIRHWAHGGATDLSNGVMLCVRCHHDIHRDSWTIHATPTEVWFTPPATIDPARRRRPGGRRLFDALAFDATPLADIIDAAESDRQGDRAGKRPPPRARRGTDESVACAIAPVPSVSARATRPKRALNDRAGRERHPRGRADELRVETTLRSWLQRHRPPAAHADARSRSPHFVVAPRLGTATRPKVAAGAHGPPHTGLPHTGRLHTGLPYTDPP
ncbi:HNH endonuclease signature motif containing protein [Demequina sp. NBRC 110057]|uniref:HNH endonuclease n=1 Tax=Demequina sp. NBRC 110057 TaxID=1570346 RepID=UPI0009FD5CC6|nr:HNH endonuclease signature motif containing protein [Demequina sp. NBRC 110057]